MRITDIKIKIKIKKKKIKNKKFCVSICAVPVCTYQTLSMGRARLWCAEPKSHSGLFLATLSGYVLDLLQREFADMPRIEQCW